MYQSTDTRTLDLPALSAAERLFIWGFRARARSGTAVPTAADIQQVYDHFRVGDAVPSLDSIIEIFACTAHTPIEVHCPTCPKMSESEHGILHAIAAAQEERIDIAREQFESWLPPVGADWALAPVKGLATIFRMAGLILPDRHIRTPGIAQTMAMKRWFVGSPTLHGRDRVMTQDARCSNVEGCDDFCRTALSLFRFIGAAYATGASDCWEAAYRFADEAPGIADSPLLVARVAALVRILRGGRACDLCFMPPSCRRLSKDEAELMRLLAVARRREPGELKTAVGQLVGIEQESAATQAVNALAFC